MLSHRGRARAGSVRTGARLGQSPRAQTLAASKRNEVFLLLFFSAKFVNVIRAKRSVGRDRDANGTVNAREFFNDGRILDIAHARATVFFREKDSRQSQPGELRLQLNPKMLRFVPFQHVRPDLCLGKLAHAHLDLFLFFVQLEFHSMHLTDYRRMKTCAPNKDSTSSNWR